MSRDRIAALLLLAFSLGYGWQTFNIPVLPFQSQSVMTARTLPQILAVAGALLSFLLLILPSPPPSAKSAKDGEDAPQPKRDWKRVILLCALMIFYGLALRPIGFIPATLAFLAACSYAMGERRWLLMAAVYIPLVVGFYLLMTKVLGQTLR
jgi:putative tricarboxylic transport membrane protein